MSCWCKECCRIDRISRRPPPTPAVLEKKCGRCKEVLGHQNFGSASGSSDGLQKWCRECRSKYDSDNRDSITRRAREARQAKPEEYRRFRSLASKCRDYGISVSEYDEMLASQSGVCAICRKECKSGKRLSIDHNHETGEVRGLLCGKCNSVIGYADDCISTLRAAIEYLRGQGGES